MTAQARKGGLGAQPGSASNAERRENHSVGTAATSIWRVDCAILSAAGNAKHFGQLKLVMSGGMAGLQRLKPRMLNPLDAVAS